MEQKFASVIGVEHACDLIEGYDDIVSMPEDSTELTPQAHYASAVLDLDVRDEEVDGVESFLDKIKRGATKVYEWIKSIIKAIKDWLFGKERRKVMEVEKDISKKADDLDKLILQLTDLTKRGPPIEEMVNNASFNPEGRLKVINAIRKVRTEDKKIINDTVVNYGNVVKDDTAEKFINEMGIKLSHRLDSVAKDIEEIKRVDPEGKISKELDIDAFMNLYSKADISESKDLLNSANSLTIKQASEHIVNLAKKFDAGLASAVKSLEKMNSEGPFVGEDPRARQVARAGKVTMELGNAANKMRDLVMSLDSQLLKVSSKIETAVVRAKLVEAMKYTSDASAEYLQMALDELGS